MSYCKFTHEHTTARHPPRTKNKTNAPGAELLLVLDGRVPPALRRALVRHVALLPAGCTAVHLDAALFPQRLVHALPDAVVACVCVATEWERGVRRLRGGGGGEGQTHATTPTMMDGHSHRHGHVRVQRKSARCACRHLRSSVLSGETPAMPLARICSTTAGPSFST